MADWLTAHWYRQQLSWLTYLLLPLEWLFRLLAAKRRDAYLSGDKASYRAPVPVVVVGNISVGGVGKTPLVISLANHLKKEGLRAGVISRGYGGQSKTYPADVQSDSDPDVVGDEPVLIALNCDCPVVVDPKRDRGVRYLLNHYDVDLILADDGLQHYALERDFELAVIDGQRGLGNEHCLPAGPLRESAERLADVDWVLINGGDFQWPEAVSFQLADSGLCTLDGQSATLPSGRVHGVAGIGNPQRFFQTLKNLGFEPLEHPFPDHHRFSEADFQFNDALPIIMTTKDAIKCRAFNLNNGYYLAVNAQLPAAFLQDFTEQVKNACSSNTR